MEVTDESCNYKLINNFYYYTDISSGKHYKYIEENWIEVKAIDVPPELLEVPPNIEKLSNEPQNSVTVDGEGRKYYQADGYSLCQNSDGTVFFLNGNNQWEVWDTKDKKADRWYFYKGNDKLYRDSDSGKLYKLNKSSNDFEEVKENKKVNRYLVNEEEEFDSEDDELEEMTPEDSNIPLGADTDPNIIYDGQTYTKTDLTDGTPYEWDFDKRAWIPKVDEDFMAKYQMSYGFNPDGTKDENPLKFDDDKEELEEEEEEKEQKKLEASKQEEKKSATWFEVDDRFNNKVYVTNLPLDITEEEFIDFMQKCGLVLKDISTNKFKIKMYKLEDGKFKGDALCTYIKVESVYLALQILDGYVLRDKTIGVERAKFTQKGQYDPSFKPKKKRKKDLDKLQKKQEKLFAWAPDPLRGERAKHENTVILRNVFLPSEFEASAERILEHQEAIRSCCQAFGTIKKVEVFDRHQEGIVKVTFEEIEVADMCVSTLNNRLYGKRILSVETWDGKDKFKIEETEEERQLRIKNWETYLDGNKHT